jgi:hypothetical protein
MDINIEAIMDALVYTHSGYDFKELVLRVGSAQRDNQIGKS